MSRGGANLSETSSQQASWWQKLLYCKPCAIAIIIILQTLVYCVAGASKAYLHMDEAYSYGLANYPQLEIQDNEDFYNHWHDGQYYADYLVVDETEQGDFTPVYNNQRDDVHPPFFYLFLRMFMELTPARFTKWTGLALNMICFAINTIFLYLVIEKLMTGEKFAPWKVFILTLAASLTISSISTVLYIRMYAMLTMWVTILVYLHLKLLDSKKLNFNLLASIGVSAVLGVLTQYYCLFILAPLFIMTAWRYGRAKQWAQLRAYIITFVVAGGITLLIWPYIIQHLFFGYRGQGVMSNLLNPAQIGTQLGIFFGLVTKFVFSYTLPFVLIAMFIIMLRGLMRHKVLAVEKTQNQYYQLILWPAVFFFIIAAIASPYTDLRYIEAVCGLLFISVMFGLYKLMSILLSDERRDFVFVVILLVIVLLPIPLRLEPDVQYTRWAKVVTEVERGAEIPALYIFNQQDNRFLDDILLFTKLKNSYVANQERYTTQDFQQILAGKDLSTGLWVSANYGDQNQQYLDVLKEATGLETQEYVFRLNAADLYYLQ